MLKFIKNYYHIIILLILSVIAMIILRLDDYPKAKDLSLYKQMSLIFNNLKVTKLYDTILNPILTSFKYLFMFFMLIYACLYINNADSKMISYSLHKNSIKNNILRILLTNMKNTLIFVGLVFVTNIIMYCLFNYHIKQEDLLLIFAYFIRLYLIILFIVFVYDLLVVLDKEVLWYYISSFSFIIILYIDISEKFSNILMSSSIQEEQNKIIALIIINLLVMLIFSYVYKRKGDLL